MAELFDLEVSEIRQGVALGEISALDVTQAYLERIKAHPELNAYVRTCDEKALARAREVDLRRKELGSKPLLGVPVALKDNILTKGTETNCASRILEGFIPPYDATVTRKLEEAGAIIIGKTNLDEFTMGSSSETSYQGPVRNPWDRERVPGGSSGGSAAAVAARLVPGALGSDTGGSIRQPASFCGIPGIKPTYGRVSRYGIVAYASSLDQVGTFGRGVRDTALLLGAISGHDPRDSTTVDQPVPDFSANLGSSIRGVRIGIPKEYFIQGLQGEVLMSVQKVLHRLSDLGAELVDISLPHTEYAVAAYYIIAPAEASSNLSRYDGVRYVRRAEKPADLQDLYVRSRSEGFGKEVQRRILIGTYVLSSGYYDAYYLRAQKVRRLIANDFKNVFVSYCDLVLCPTAPSTAFKLGEKLSDPLSMYLSDVFTVPASLAGLPAMSVPCGQDSGGLPVGFQLIGRPWDEETVFRVAYAYEQSSDWQRRAAI